MDLSTLEEGYLSRTPTHFLAKFYIKFKNEIILFQKNKKPNVQNAFFEEDKKNFLKILNIVIKERPENLVTNIKKNRILKVKCKDNYFCYWYYINSTNNEIRQEGFLEFNEQNTFHTFIDTTRNIKLVLKN